MVSCAFIHLPVAELKLHTSSTLYLHAAWVACSTMPDAQWVGCNLPGQ